MLYLQFLQCLYLFSLDPLLQKGIDVSCHLAMSMRHSKTNTQTKTNTKCFKDPMYVIFFKSTGFKDFKYDMDMDMQNMVVMDMDVVDTKTNAKTKTKTN